jgi:hypothetical protein
MCYIYEIEYDYVLRCDSLMMSRDVLTCIDANVLFLYSYCVITHLSCVNIFSPFYFILCVHLFYGTNTQVDD